MKDFRGSEIKSDFAKFMSNETNLPLEFWHTKITVPEIKPWKLSIEPLSDIKLHPIKSFDYRDLIKGNKFNPEARPSSSDVINFMIKERGHTPDSAIFELIPKINNIFVDGKIRSLGSNASFVMKGF
ncbi:MAG: hypothetical protein Q8L26_08460 [Candidatus Omnitrophota bacterium]|nr:hypothetical protein [Candidatus Omnitrophota bacterium]